MNTDIFAANTRITSPCWSRVSPRVVGRRLGRLAEALELKPRVVAGG